MDSPYQPGFGARPAVIVGRETHFARVRGALTRVRNSGEVSPAHQVFTGARGLGKTVTLAVAGDIAVQQGFITSAAAMDRVSDNIQVLAGAIAEAVAPLQHTAAATIWARLRNAWQPCPSKSTPASSQSPPPAGPGHQIRKQPASQRQMLAGLITDATAVARAKDHSGLVLLLDELQEAPQPQLVILANAIQDAGRVPHTPLLVLAAGLPTTPELVMAAASFTERFDFRTLGRLDRPDAERALLEPALQHHVRWDQAAADHAIDAAGGSPYLIQYIGDETWNHAHPETGAIITLRHVTAAIADVQDNLEAGMFRGRWQKTTTAEKAVLLAIAAAADNGGTASTTDVSKMLDVDTRNWSMARQSLIDKGLIEPAGYGHIRFTMPGFIDYLAALTDPDPRKPTITPSNQPEISATPSETDS